MARQAKNTKTNMTDSSAVETKSTAEVASVKTDEVNDKKTITKITEPLKDTDEIEVVSLIAHVSYKDHKTGDLYEWENVGDVESIPFSVLKEMRRGYKSYFNDLWLKPNDERVIDYFKLNKVYEKYESLLEKEAYTPENIDEVVKIISSLSNSIKITVYNKIREMVINGEIVNVNVVRTIERKLNMDLLYLL